MHTTTTTTAQADRAAAFRDHVLRAHAIADASVVSMVECECVHAVGPDGLLWYDTSPLIDQREHGPMGVDLNVTWLLYAEERQLIQRHRDPARAHLVRVITPRP